MKKAIIAVNGRFLLQPITGVQRYAYELLKALARLSPASFELLCVIPPGGKAQNIKGLRFLVDDGHSLPSPLWQQFRLPYLARRAGAGMIWSPSNIGPVFPGMRQIVTVFDGAVYAGPAWFDWKFRLYYRAVLDTYKSNAEAILTCSEFSRSELEKYLGIPRMKIFVAYGAVAPSFGVDKGSSPVSGRYVLSLGSRDPRKNVAALISAWGQIPAAAKNGRRLIVAGGSHATFSSEKLKGYFEDVLFPGYIKDEDLPALYSHADCFVYPSLYEGFGLPPLEAMACGCPVVVSDRGSLPEVCGDAALYVDPTNPSAIASAIVSVLTDNRLRECMVLKGHENARRFNWEISALKVKSYLDGMF